jgi:hypothetical protein
MKSLLLRCLMRSPAFDVPNDAIREIIGRVCTDKKLNWISKQAGLCAIINSLYIWAAGGYYDFQDTTEDRHPAVLACAALMSIAGILFKLIDWSPFVIAGFRGFLPP